MVIEHCLLILPDYIIPLLAQILRRIKIRYIAQAVYYHRYNNKEQHAEQQRQNYIAQAAVAYML